MVSENNILVVFLPILIVFVIFFLPISIVFIINIAPEEGRCVVQENVECLVQRLLNQSRWEKGMAESEASQLGKICVG